MKRFAFAALAAGLLWAGQACADDGQIQLTPVCGNAMDADLQAMLEASKAGDTARAAAKAEALETACAADLVGRPLIAVLHAQIDLQRGDAAAVTRRLDALGLPSSPGMYAMDRWLYLAAAEATGDKARFLIARDEFLARHDREMVARTGVRRIEVFETPAATVYAYEGAVRTGPFMRRMVLVASPKNGGWPAAIAVTDEARLDAAPGAASNNALVTDLYDCRTKSVVAPGDIIKAGKIDYAVVKAFALKAFSDPAAFRPFQVPDKPKICAFQGFVAPGFAPQEAG